MAANMWCIDRSRNIHGESDKRQELFDDDDDEEVEQLTLNTSYAERYGKWREKEEFEKLKARYGKKEYDDDLSDSSSSSEDETGSRLPHAFDKQFFNTLACLKSKDSKIYDKSVKFFSDDMNFDNAPSTSKKKTKPMYVHDHERRLLLATNGELPDEEEENKKQMRRMNKKKKSLTYAEEQKQLKESFKCALADSDDDELFTGVKEHTDEEDEPQAEASLMKDKALAESIHNIWRDDDDDLDDNDKFLRDYLVKKKYEVHGSEHENHEDEEIDSDDIDSFSKEQELFEHKYNFRFEEPDQEFIKRYPRTMNNLLRRKDTARKDKRLETRERKNAEKLQKREEIKRLKALKKKEILDRLKTIQNVTGNDKVGFNEIDLDEEFDPEEHDKRMREVFDDDYYGVEEEERPEFPEDEELDDNENWDEWDPNHDVSYNYENDNNNEVHCEDPDFNMDCDYDPNAALQQEFISSSKKLKRRKGKLANALLRKKPVFDPNDKSFEEYFDEYFKLDYEDNIGDLLCRFKYRKVIPNDYGLDTEEILAADDKELNRWCSLRKTCQHRTKDEENYDVQAYKKKACNVEKKMHILKSVYQKDEPEESGKQNETEANEPEESDKHNETWANEPEETDAVPSQGEINTGKRKRKRKKEIQTSVDASDITTTEPGINEIEEQPVKKNKNKHKKKWKNNYELEATIPDSRLKAYNINPKKFKNKLKYSKVN